MTPAARAERVQIAYLVVLGFALGLVASWAAIIACLQ